MFFLGSEVQSLQIFWTMLLSQSASGSNKTEAIPSSPPQMVAVELEGAERDEFTLSSYSFLEEMEALESEYDRDLAGG